MVFRLNGDDLVFGVPVHPTQPHIPQMKMMKVHIPFTFKLQETSQSSYSGEWYCKIGLYTLETSVLADVFTQTNLSNLVLGHNG